MISDDFEISRTKETLSQNDITMPKEEAKCPEFQETENADPRH